MTTPGPPAVIPSGPKPPNDTHDPFHRLSWAFYKLRLRALDDKYFDPWEGKQLKICKTIMEKKARGDWDEAIRRSMNLVSYFKLEPIFWSLEPKMLLSQWERLALPPVITGGQTELKRAHVHAERNQRWAKLQQEVDNERARMAETGDGDGDSKADVSEPFQITRNHGQS